MVTSSKICPYIATQISHLSVSLLASDFVVKDRLLAAATGSVDVTTGVDTDVCVAVAVGLIHWALPVVDGVSVRALHTPVDPTAEGAPPAISVKADTLEALWKERNCKRR